MKKRIRMGTSIILAALLAMSIPSCAPSGGTGGAQDSSSEEPLQTGQKELSDTSLPFADGDVTLSLLTFDSWYAPASYADSLPVWEEMEKRTGVKIEFQVVPYADSEAVIQTRLASGSNLPDITAVPPWTTTAGVTQYAQEDVLLCLDPYLENGAMPSTEAFLKEYPNIAAQMQSTDGSYYAVANVIALVNPVIPRAIIVRDDWLKKAGFENVEDLVTVEDWETYLRAVRDGDYNGNGKADEIPLITENVGQLLSFSSGFGFDVAPDDQSNFFYYDEDGTVSFALADDRMKDCVAWLRDLYAEGLIYNQLENNSETIWSLYPQDIVGAHCKVAVDYITRADGLLAGIDDNALHLMTTTPSESRENLCKMQMRPDVEFRFAITTACQNPDIAAKWVDYVWASKDGNILKDFGIKGLSYDEADDGTLYYTDYILKNDQNLSAHDMMRTLGGAPSFLVLDSLESWEQKQKGTSVWSEGERLSDRLTSPFPMMVLTMEENETILNLLPDFQTYYLEMITKFITGTESMDQWDAYVENLRALGLEEITAVYQAEIDRYLEFVNGE